MCVTESSISVILKQEVFMRSHRGGLCCWEGGDPRWKAAQLLWIFNAEFPTKVAVKINIKIPYFVFCIYNAEKHYCIW